MLLFFSLVAWSQKVEFIEYDLDNGLHVILHQDNTAPVVTVSVLYHVGAKDEDPERTGFAHFFEHLLFEGTENIDKGKWMNIVASRGGSNNAYTTQDFTYYYENFPSNNIELGLWMESERLLHPVIDQVGVETQNEVVKEERRLRYDNSPYGKWYEVVKSHLFEDHPYKNSTIGKMEHLDAATLDEFIAFNEKYYVPNNAVLTVAGDIDIDQTKKWIQDYFGPIPKGEEIARSFPIEEPIKETIEAETFDSNIQIPAIFTAYRIPGLKSREAKVMNMISTYLSEGNSSKLYKRLVEEKKMALQVLAFNDGGEDYGTYVILALPQVGNELEDLLTEIDDEVKKLQDGLISERDHQKLLNIYEDNFVNSNSSVAGIAGSLAQAYALLGDTNSVNTEIEEYRSITREEIQDAARKFLNPNQRLVLHYLPEEEENEQEPETEDSE